MEKMLIALMILIISVCSSPINGNKGDSIDKREVSMTIKEESVTINKDTEWAIHGTLTIPDGATGPVSAVVLVAGSGPNDRDETIYSNKPFKDIADYLTSKGIAVLRFDKRTLTYQSKVVSDIANFTVDQEYIQDSIAAVNFLKEDTRIDKTKVFILGHSEGGMLAPRIDSEGGDSAGIIIMAGSPRSFAEIIYDQNMAIINTLPAEHKTIAQGQVDTLMAVFANLKTMSNDDAKKVSLAGATGYYYKEMDAHPASEYLENMTKPVLIMQGEKDFQVYANKDYKAYQTILDGKSNASFKLYIGLNHLFMTSTTGTVEEYKTPSHVDQAVLKDLSTWILSN
ncbi:prolyl oligopeptidase family serine peptidase [Paenibacillus qinlingensis]|uniref:Dienelactone hydrolase n=1 Tax=Paenibacillus qinlingensis TaxID=1837343 RepID=A0ABU1P1A6_9BACL|nr:prolyl oligopeptidase family serine peptidase [Paenibacillus qinlingensis]MDR6553334.1 dienelactone hydrolase [Paenibacillus qinlingensis]